MTPTKPKQCFFNAYEQELNYRFLDKTHGPYFFTKGDTFSQGHAEQRKDLRHRGSICQSLRSLRKGSESPLGHGAGGRRESSAGRSRLPKFSGTQRLAATLRRARIWQQSCIARMYQEAFPLILLSCPSHL